MGPCVPPRDSCSTDLWGSTISSRRTRSSSPPALIGRTIHLPPYWKHFERRTNEACALPPSVPAPSPLPPPDYWMGARRRLTGCTRTNSLDDGQLFGWKRTSSIPTRDKFSRPLAPPPDSTFACTSSSETTALESPILSRGASGRENLPLVGIEDVRFHP